MDVPLPQVSVALSSFTGPGQLSKNTNTDEDIIGGSCFGREFHETATGVLVKIAHLS